MTSRKFLLLLFSSLCISALGFILFIFVLQPPSNPSLVSKFKACTDESVKITTDSMNCAKDSLVELASTGFVSDSLSLLEQTVSKDPAYTAACHGWAHSIGLAAASSNSYSSEFVLGLHWPNCTYGFNHGVQSFFFKDMDSVKDAEVFYSSVCAPIVNESSMDKYNSCIHLFGHFVADLVASDPAMGFDACSSISGDSSYCIDGLIMRFAEFIDLENGGSDTFTEQSFDVSSFDSRATWGDSVVEVSGLLSSYCLELEGRDRVTCAKRAPAVLARALQRDNPGMLDTKWPVVYDFCHGLDAAVREYCFEGIGIIALNMSGWAPEVLVQACDFSLGAGSVPCVKAVARAFAYNNPTASADEAFCKFVASELIDSCREGFASGL